jgi:hypothetical protein
MSEKALYVEGEDYVQKPKTQKILVEVDFALVFSSRYKYTVRLKSVWSSKYFDWLVTQCNDTNEIYIGVRSQEKFFADIQRSGMRPPADRTMKDVMKELVEEHLIIRIGRGLYKINPIIIWKGHSRARIDTIKTMVGAGINLDPIVYPAQYQNVEQQDASPTLPLSREENLEDLLGPENEVDGPDSEQVI